MILLQYGNECKNNYRKLTLCLTGHFFLVCKIITVLLLVLLLSFVLEPVSVVLQQSECALSQKLWHCCDHH